MRNALISPLQSCSEHHLRQLFNRPWLVALLVGSSSNELVIFTATNSRSVRITRFRHPMFNNPTWRNFRIVTSKGDVK